VAQFNGNQYITGAVITTSNIQVGGYVQTSLLYNGGAIEIRSNYLPLQLNSNGATTIINDNTQISGSLRVSGSIFSNGFGLISGSSQLTASYDTRYVVSGSITQTTWDNIASKPSGIISGSSQLTSSMLATTGSNLFVGTQTLSGSIIPSTDNTYDLLKGTNSFKVNLDGLEAGKYSFSVKELNSKATYSSSFEILDFDVEKQFSSANLSKMKQLASQTNSTTYFPNQIEQLIQSLIASNEYVSIEKNTISKKPLIDSVWLLVLVALTLALEWFLRKYKGLL
jgi:hypothetical protein